MKRRLSRPAESTQGTSPQMVLRPDFSYSTSARNFNCYRIWQLVGDQRHRERAAQNRYYHQGSIIPFLFDVGTAKASGMAASGMAKKPIFLLSETSEEEARRKVCSR